MSRLHNLLLPLVPYTLVYYSWWSCLGELEDLLSDETKVTPRKGWDLLVVETSFNVCVCAAVYFFCYLVAVVWFNVYDNWCNMFDNCQIGRWKLSMILLGRQRKLWNVDTKAKVLAKNKINFEGCTSFDNFLILFLTKKLKKLFTLF